LYAFIHDAKRFALYNRSVIEQAPLQLYCSALLFAPEKSIIREIFEKCIPTWIERKPRMQAHWSAALQTLEGHSEAVSSVAFSPEGNILPTLRVSDYWVIEGEANILWLPPDYRSMCEAIWDQTVILGHSLGRLSFLQFKQGLKFVI
jgi:WD40 repeat protein